MHRILFYLLLLKNTIQSLKIINHPFESRAAYVYGIKNLNRVDTSIIKELQYVFKRSPLLIFKDVDPPSPNEFIDFLKHFDEDCDLESLYNPSKYPNQLLQPFDQFPDCRHVAPRGNAEITNFYNIKNIKVKPMDTFINNYLWHTDLLGHEYKLPNVITGFYIVEQPLIGGDTDFISGETIYESLSEELQEASKNMLLEINRHKFILKNKKLDYAGASRLEPYENYSEGKSYLPLVFAPDSTNEKPKVLILPSFFEKVVGWNVDESRAWIKNFMIDHVLPHRISIQWKKNDLGIFNNRRFMHSSTPARNYLEFTESSKRLLLQTFLPTNKPLLGIKPIKNNNNSIYNVKWILDKNKSNNTSNELLKYSITTNLYNNKQNETELYYPIVIKPENIDFKDIKLNPYR
jgi:alpha-ketoglutarate-dependent taurine dioxygenase